jgi:hypothetical protein
VELAHERTTLATLLRQKVPDLFHTASNPSCVTAPRPPSHVLEQVLNPSARGLECVSSSTSVVEDLPLCAEALDIYRASSARGRERKRNTRRHSRQNISLSLLIRLSHYQLWPLEISSNTRRPLYTPLSQTTFSTNLFVFCCCCCSATHTVPRTPHHSCLHHSFSHPHLAPRKLPPWVAVSRNTISFIRAHVHPSSFWPS